MTTFRHPIPTATANQHRMQVFQPTRRPGPVNETITTSWGNIRVKGKLGQSHADVLDAICFCAEGRGDLDGDRIKLLVDPAQVRRRCALGGEQFRKICDDLLSALIEIYEPAKLACVGHLIDHIDTAVRSDGTAVTRLNPLGGDRPLWRIELGKALCKLIKHDVWLNYDPEPVVKLQNGISQAVARHILSHKQAPAGGWKIDTLIAAVAGNLSDSNMRNRRRELRSDGVKLQEIGIVLDQDRIRQITT